MNLKIELQSDVSKVDVRLFVAILLNFEKCIINPRSESRDSTLDL